MAFAINPQQIKLFFLLIAAQWVFLPSHIQRIDFRQFAQVKPLKVSIRRTSPPMAVLEDTMIRVRAPATAQESIELKSGLQTPQTELPPPRAYRTVRLNGLTLNKAEARSEPVNSPTLSTPSREMIGSLQRPVRSFQPQKNQNPPGFNSSAQKHTMAATAASQPQLNETPTRGTIWLNSEKPVSIPATASKAVPPLPKPNVAKNESSPAPAQLPSGTPKNQRSQNNAVSNFDHNSGPVVISGPIEIKGGLAYTGGDDTITVFRQVGNSMVETGRVWIREGRYEITVAGPYGLVVGELRHSNGELVGRGEIWLEDVGWQSASRSEETLLALQPVSTSVAARTISSYSYEGHDDIIAESKVSFPGIEVDMMADKHGEFKTPEAVYGSSFIIKSRKSGFWNGLAIATNVSPYSVTMYSESMVRALHNLIGKQEGLSLDDLQKSGIIWGRVTRQGQALENTKVELSDGQAIGPIYFNALHLPDPYMQATGKNGMFVFLKVGSGMNVVRAFHQGRSLPSKVVLTDSRHVSHVVLEASQKRTADVYVADAVTKQALVSTVKFVGSVKSGRTTKDGALRLKYSSGNEPMFLEVDSGNEYKESRISTHRKVRFITVPQVSTAFYENLVRQLPVNLNPELGVILGFIENRNFVSYLDRLDKEYLQTFYFNSQGQITPAGEPGGGFIIVNVNPGPRTITVTSDQNTAPWTQIVLVDPAVLALVSHQF